MSRNFCRTDCVAEAITGMGVAVVVDSGAVDEIGVAVEADSEVAAVSGKTKLTLATGHLDDSRPDIHLSAPVVSPVDRCGG
jgi:hypothetical protein